MTLLLLSRRVDGRLLRAAWTGTCLRVALLVDLIFEGRLHDDLTAFSVITTPVGFAPADDLLAAVDRCPDRSLTFWIGRGPSVREALAEQWVRDGVLWTKPRRLHRHPRYGLALDATWSHTACTAEIARLKQLANAPETASRVDACLAALAVLGGVIDYEVRPSPSLIRRCGTAAWLVQQTDALILESTLNLNLVGGG